MESRRQLRFDPEAIVIIVVGLAILLTAVLSTVVQGRALSGTEVESFLVSTPKQTVDRAFVGNDRFTKKLSARVEAGIIPHHDLVSPMIAGWFSGLADRPAPDTIVVVGPDHRDAGRSDIMTSRTSWRWAGGVTTVNTALVNALIESGQVQIDDPLVSNEHSIWTVVPYLARTFPRTKIVPIVLRGGITPIAVRDLSELLNSHMGNNDILLASVDFSHYRNLEGAWKDDQQSLAVIRRSDAAAAMNISVDSPPAISLVLWFAASRQLTFNEIAHTNSAEVIGNLNLTSTTSYVSAYFSEKSGT